MTVTQQLSAAKEYAQLWDVLMPYLPSPEESQFAMWAGLHTPELVSQGINRAARKSRRMLDTDSPMSTEDATKYASSVMKNELLGHRKFPTGDHQQARNAVAPVPPRKRETHAA
jgi:hypothetical protein